MPQLTPTQVQAGAVRAGDVLDTGEVVVSVDAKVKWATITVESGKSHRVLSDSVIEVQRMQPTEQELADKELERNRRRITEQHLSMVADPTVKLQAEIQKNREAGSVEFASHWAIDRFLSAQALYKFAASARTTANRLVVQEHLADFHDADLLAAAYHEMLQGARRRSSFTNPLSRSTSVISNLFEDLDAWAAAKVEDEFKYGVDRYAAACYDAVVAAQTAHKAGE